VSRKLTIGVLFGGRSTEHQVSLVSATSVLNALDSDKYDIVPIGITPDGQWLVGQHALALLKQGKMDPQLKVFLPADPTIKKLARIDTGDYGEKIDVIFPVLHGAFGEDGTMQGLLELADLPYVGADVLGSAVAMDKIVQKQVCVQAGLPAVDYVWFRAVDWFAQSDGPAPVIEKQLANMSQEEIVQTIEEQLGLPVFIKPPNLGSSVGISRAAHHDELCAGIELALQFDRKVLIEAAVPNAREIEVAVLGNDRPRASVAGEVIPSNEFYDYDAKYVDNASKLVIPADVPEKIHDAIREAAVKSVIAVGAEGMSRVDFILDSRTNKFYLNEINTIPGFTSISMYPKLWAATGLSYPELLDELIRLAIERHDKKAALKTSYQPTKEWHKNQG